MQAFLPGQLKAIRPGIDLADLAAGLGKLRPLAGVGQSGPAMARSRKTVAKKTALAPLDGYDLLIADVVQVIGDARAAGPH